MTGIRLLNKDFILDPRVRGLMINKNLELLVRCDEDYAFVKECNLKNSMTEYKETKTTLCRRYVDEPYSSPEAWKPTADSNPNTIFGETFRNVWKLKKTNNVTLTVYSTLLIFSQLTKWRILNLFRGDKFNICWINPTKNSCSISSLIKWADKHGKEKWYYFEDDLTIEKVIELMNKYL